MNCRPAVGQTAGGGRVDLFTEPARARRRLHLNVLRFCWTFCYDAVEWPGIIIPSSFSSSGRHARCSRSHRKLAQFIVAVLRLLAVTSPVLFSRRRAEHEQTMADAAHGRPASPAPGRRAGGRRSGHRYGRTTLAGNSTVYAKQVEPAAFSSNRWAVLIFSCFSVMLPV